MAAALRGAFYSRHARKIAPEYDVRLSAYNLTDWGLPAIHFIADFSWDKPTREALHPPSPGFIYRETPLRRAYLEFARACEGKSGRDFMNEDLVIANSEWSARILRERFGLRSTPVIYPAVWMKFPEIAWAEKKPDFVMIGRVAPEKRIEECVEILQEVRSRGHKIRLRLCGQPGTDHYGRRISALCDKHRDWIVAEGRVYGERKARVLAECRFGIQGTHGEGFGISVAEMVKAGAIVFAPREGGQAEILNREELLFSDKADAVRRIDTVLRDDQVQAGLLKSLRDRASLFEVSVCQVQSLRSIAGWSSEGGQFSSWNSQES
jgi:glycosyltransferase involved in cell wall biosynthesis